VKILWQTYVVNYQPEHRTVVGRARVPFFEGGMPLASTLVGVAALALPEWLVEIEAIAVIE
jgi:enamine deaminase RidA (YjgF/YER057c/UK114 family)